MKKFGAAALIILATASASHADEFTPALKSYLETSIADWAQSDVLLEAIRSANARTSGYDAARIDEMDQAWRAEVGAASSPTIQPVLESAAADFLRDQVERSGGAITEAFVMDSVGLNVAASDVTSDMWQGDEAKFQKTYSVGAGAVHIGDVEFDESSQSYSAQISVSISDPATGELLGALTVGIDPEGIS